MTYREDEMSQRAKWVGSQLVFDDGVCGRCGLEHFPPLEKRTHDYEAEFDMTGGREEFDEDVKASWREIATAGRVGAIFREHFGA